MEGGASFRHPSGRWAGLYLGLAAQPRFHGERRAKGARRSCRCRSPRPQLRDFTKAIPARNARSAEAQAGRRSPARQGGAAESTNTKPSDGNARGSCRSAACFGASPVAAASDLESRRDPALDSHHSTTAPPATWPQPDISTWQRIGHFYLALTHEIPPPVSPEAFRVCQSAYTEILSCSGRKFRGADQSRGVRPAVLARKHAHDGSGRRSPFSLRLVRVRREK